MGRKHPRCQRDPPTADRPALPLLGPAAARAYVAEIRDRALDRLHAHLGDEPFAPGGDPLLEGAFVYGMVLQHEHQHDETILATRQLMGERATPPVGTTPAPAVGATLPEQVLADTGYKAEAVFKALAHSGCDLVVALGREGKDALCFDPERSPHTAAMAAKLQTYEGKAAYRRRKWIAEPPNGWIKHVLGFRQFSLRGLHRVRAEWKLVCLALNLRRMAAM